MSSKSTDCADENLLVKVRERRAVCEDITEFADHSDNRVRAEVALSVRLPDDIRDLLIHDSDPAVRTKIASHAALSDNQVCQLSGDSCPAVRFITARRRTLPAEAEQRLAWDANEDIRSTMASRRDITDVSMEAFVQDRSSRVRSLATQRKELTPAHVDHLIEDESPYVLQSLLRSAPFTEAQLDRFVERMCDFATQKIMREQLSRRYRHHNPKRFFVDLFDEIMRRHTEFLSMSSCKTILKNIRHEYLSDDKETEKLLLRHIIRHTSDENDIKKALCEFPPSDFASAIPMIMSTDPSHAVAECAAERLTKLASAIRADTKQDYLDAWDKLLSHEGNHYVMLRYLLQAAQTATTYQERNHLSWESKSLWQDIAAALVMRGCKHPAADRELVSQAARINLTQTCRAVNGVASIYADILAERLRANTDVANRLAGDASTSSALLHELAHHLALHVRRNLSYNASTPDDTIVMLMLDKESEVASAAAVAASRRRIKTPND